MNAASSIRAAARGREGVFPGFMEFSVYNIFGKVFPLAIGAGVMGILSFVKGIVPLPLAVLPAIAGLFGALGLRLLEGKLQLTMPLASDRDRLAKRVFFWCWAGLFIAQVIMLLSTDFTPKNDLAYVCQAAKDQVLQGRGHIYDGLPWRHQHYFAVYPNNHMLYFCVYVVYRIWYFATGTISNVPLMVLNLMGLNLSFVTAYKCARLLYPPERVLTCVLRAMLFTPLISYVCIFYTDAAAMLPLSLSVYLYLKFIRSNPRKYRYLAGSGVMLGLAYKLKGSAAILVIAFVLDLLLKERTARERLRALGALVPVFAAFCLGASLVCSSLLGITKEESDRYKFPPIHWIMMSADGRGGYESADFLYTQSFQGYDAKVAADHQRLTAKLERQGPIGFTAHLARKLSYTWRDCTFMAPYYSTAKALNNGVFYVGSMVCHFTLLFSAELSLIMGRHRSPRREEAFVIPLTLLGLFCFLLLWEARSRYLISYFLLFVLI